MHFNYLHFFIDDLNTWHDRFAEEWGATPLGQASSDGSFDGNTRVLCLGRVPLVLSAPATAGDSIDRYLDHHPPGIGDVAFRVSHLETAVKRLMDQGTTLVDAIGSGPDAPLKWCRVPGWGRTEPHPGAAFGAGGLGSRWGEISPWLPPTSDQSIDGIDHASSMWDLVNWLKQWNGMFSTLAFALSNGFTIDTPKSGLKSQVLAHPQGDAQLPINEPATP